MAVGLTNKTTSMKASTGIVLIWIFLLLSEGGGERLLKRCISSVDHFYDAIHIPPAQWDGEVSSLLPPWADIPLAHRGQKFAGSHTIGVAEAYLWGLTAILGYPQARDTLLYTGHSSTVPKAGHRFAATVVQIGLWLRSPISTKDLNNNWVLESVRRTRTIHDHVTIRIQRDMDRGNGNFPPNTSTVPYNRQLWSDFLGDLWDSDIPWEYRVPIPHADDPRIHPNNQLHLAIVQWAFLGSVLMNPEAVNVFRSGEEGRRAFSHLWAIYGYSQGLKDEYNLGLACNGTQLSREFFNKFILPSLFNLSRGNKHLMETWIKASPHVVIGLDPEFLLRGVLTALVGITPKRMNARRGVYNYAADFLNGPVEKGINFLFPPWDWVSSPIAQLYHYVIGLLHFFGKYKGDEAIAKTAFVYDFHGESE